MTSKPFLEQRIRFFLQENRTAAKKDLDKAEGEFKIADGAYHSGTVNNRQHNRACDQLAIATSEKSLADKACGAWEAAGKVHFPVSSFSRTRQPQAPLGQELPSSWVP